jgi:hypothetical protein
MTWSVRLSGLDAVALIASKLERAPRYRQRLPFVPLGLGRPAEPA